MVVVLRTEVYSGAILHKYIILHEVSCEINLCCQAPGFWTLQRDIPKMIDIDSARM